MISFYASFQAEKCKQQIVKQPLQQVCGTSMDRLCTYIQEVEKGRVLLQEKFKESNLKFRQALIEYKKKESKEEDGYTATRYCCWGFAGAFLVPPVAKVLIVYGAFCCAAELSISLYKSCAREWTNIIGNTPVHQEFAPTYDELDKARVLWIKKVHKEIQHEIECIKKKAPPITGEDSELLSQLLKVDETFSKAVGYLDMLETVAPIELFPLRLCMKVKNSIAGIWH
ncbi:MAG: hypothetical protein JSR58_07635 [Verrucomicrobia bacterium]|nr:hypothetical protein [Verrucomicrobiota bacterium]